MPFPTDWCISVVKFKTVAEKSRCKHFCRERVPPSWANTNGHNSNGLRTVNVNFSLVKFYGIHLRAIPMWVSAQVIIIYNEFANYIFEFTATSQSTSLHWRRVSSGQGESGKFQTWQKSGKSQGILLKVREKWILGKVREKSGNLHLMQSK